MFYMKIGREQLAFLTTIVHQHPQLYLSHQLQATICNCTNKHKMCHAKHSLFTLTVFSYVLYANLQRTTGIPCNSCALVPLILLSHQLQATMCNCTNKHKMCHVKHFLLTLTFFSSGLYANLQRTTTIPYYSHAVVPLRLLSQQLQATMCNGTKQLEMYHGKHSLYTLTVFSSGLYANLQRSTGILYYSCALLLLKLLFHQFLSTMCNYKNKLEIFHRKHSLFTFTVFSQG